ncbi:hypothetical protein [Nocardiopsis trehalosi]|jgi:hypothetical protein|uniref:hypothetical protein n=1 Tax=Nocardiopsis trehalosi TaxID=109329 RepID=UPI0008367181|nr:hypothetical protein [Nocardiopsis trehalosi]
MTGPVPTSTPADPARVVTLVLDPVTRAELERAAGSKDLASYLHVLAGRHARWNELRAWLEQLEAAYGPLPPEALERVHRQMLGLARRTADDPRTLSVAFTTEEFAALGAAAGDRPLAPFVHDLVVDHLTSARADPVPGGC